MLRLSPLKQYYCQHLDHMFQRWSWDWAHSTSLRKVSSLYAGANTLLCRHWVAKTCSLSISTALALVVGVSTGLNLSLFINTSSWKAKSGSLRLLLGVTVHEFILISICQCLCQNDSIMESWFHRSRGVSGFVVSCVSWFHRFSGVNSFMVS